jgi:hypothetical protein
MKAPPGQPEKVSDQLERFLQGEGEKTLGSLIELFEEKAFALIFILLMGVPALPLPTGGATHVFEVVTALLAFQLIVGRDAIWLPQRWCRMQLAGANREKFLRGLMKMVRRLERFSKPRFRFLFNNRVSNTVFGVLVVGGTVGAFAAPPFTGLDTLPSLGVVLLSLAVLLEDFAIAVVGIAIGVGGVILEVVLGKAAISGISNLF